MNLDQLQHKLLAAARANPPSERVPYAFEQRVLARLRAKSAPDGWAVWARALWLAAAPCVALMLLLGAWSLSNPATRPAAPPDLSQALDNTVLAAADQELSADSLW